MGVRPEMAPPHARLATRVGDVSDIAHLHTQPGTGVVVIAGGGSGALEALLTLPGASRTLLEARVPYASGALTEWLGGVPDRACAPETAQDMAMAAYSRARHLDPNLARFGVGCTASLRTDRPKRGTHRVHVATQTATATHLWSLTFDTGARTRAEEEAVCVALALNAIAKGKGLPPLRTPALRTHETLLETHQQALPHWQELLHGRHPATHYAYVQAPPDKPYYRPVFPGAFNPLHAGHLEMAQLAAERIGAPTEFEICVCSADKPMLNYADIARRTKAFNEEATIWLTRAPTFAEKAALFPGAVFTVGIDTIARVAEPRYYGQNPDTRDAAMAAIAAAGCSFLVFGRTLAGKFTNLGDLELPDTVLRLAEGVGEADFRVDLSSSSLRRPHHQETSEQ